MLFYPKGKRGKTRSHDGCSTPGCSISIRMGTQRACLKLTANKQTCFKRKGPILLIWDSLKSMEKKLFLASLLFGTQVSCQPDISVVTLDLCQSRKRESFVTGPSEKRGEGF